MSSRSTGQEPTGDLGRLFVLATVAIATILVFGQVLGFDILFGWDDELYLLRRKEVTDWFHASWSDRLLTPKTGYPVPVPTFLYHLAWRMPEGWLLPVAHGWSLFFHLINVGLVAELARRWLGGWRWAGAVALLWGTHPLLVESVAWITNLKGLTVAACILGATLLWDTYLRRGGWCNAGGVLLLSLVGLGCRPEAVMIGPLMVLLTLTSKRSHGRDWRVWTPIIMVALTGVAYLPYAMSGQEAVLAGANRPELLETTWPETLGRIFTAFGLQLRHLFWPVELSPVYTRYYPGWQLDWWIGLGGYLLMGAASLFGLFRQHRSAVRGLGWFWCLWIPASGVVFLPRFTADTYMYLPLIGILLGAAGLVKSTEVGEAYRTAWLVAALAVVMSIPLGLQSHRYAASWRSTQTLFEPLTHRSHKVGTNFAILAYDYIRRKQWDKARKTIERGLTPLYEDGKLSLEMVKVFARTGEPVRAADLVMKMLQPEFPRDPGEAVHAYLVWLLPTQDIPLPDEGLEREQFVKSASIALDYFAGRKALDHLRNAAEYLHQHGLSQTAATYAAQAIHLNPKLCETWDLRRALGGTPSVRRACSEAP
jgi:hypothetical protein